MTELTPSAYVVLGLTARHGPMTPYELKARVEQSVGFHWPIPHAQLYRDPPRLAGMGLLAEEVEEHGRRRRVFRLTAAGRSALEAWLADPDAGEPQTRDPALLKLAFADLAGPARVVELARAQEAAHRQWLEVYRSRRAALDPADGATASRARSLALGILHERGYVAFWAALAADPDRLASPGADLPE